MNIKKVGQITDSESNTAKPDDWVRIQSWLQNAAMELDYLVWRVIATRVGKIPEEAPTLYKIAYDLEDEPLTEEGLCSRIQEIADLCRGWRTNETFPQF